MKLGNVILDHKRAVRLIDFGTARFERGEGKDGEHPRLPGTLACMSPEALAEAPTAAAV